MNNIIESVHVFNLISLCRFYTCFVCILLNYALDHLNIKMGWILDKAKCTINQNNNKTTENSSPHRVWTNNNWRAKKPHLKSLLYIELSWCIMQVEHGMVQDFSSSYKVFLCAFGIFHIYLSHILLFSLSFFRSVGLALVHCILFNIVQTICFHVASINWWKIMDHFIWIRQRLLRSFSRFLAPLRHYLLISLSLSLFFPISYFLFRLFSLCIFFIHFPFVSCFYIRTNGVSQMQLSPASKPHYNAIMPGPWNAKCTNNTI